MTGGMKASSIHSPSSSSSLSRGTNVMSTAAFSFLRLDREEHGVENVDDAVANLEREEHSSCAPDRLHADGAAVTDGEAQWEVNQGCERLVRGGELRDACLID